jgi:tryptophan halogenase
LAGEISPYTRAIAYEFGWRWRIPLQHRMGNGLVYSSQYISDDEATALFLRELGETPINTPRIIKFKPGRRSKNWSKNCVAIGLSSGFIEPLESTSIHLISSSIIRLMRMIPIAGIHQHDIDEYNRQSLIDIHDVRDFVVLHYKATERTDSDFWRYCKNMEVPESLSRRMEIYRDSARIFWSSEELFTANSWNQVMLGQGIVPKTYHPVADLMSSEELQRYLSGYRQTIQHFVQSLPTHADFLKTYCA